MKVVLANGVFDILHVGHVQHLIEARAMGDALVVALTMDDSVNKGPGRPLYAWANRAAVLRELRCVSSVMPSTNAVDAIRFLRPNIFVKGIDYAQCDQWTEDVVSMCREVGTEIRFTTSPKQSVTDIIRRVHQLHE